MADIILKSVRVAFVKIFHAEEFKPGDGKPRYSITPLVEPGSENDKAIRAAIDAEGKATYGEKWAKIHATMQGQKNQYCYLSGDTKDYDGFAGMMALACHRRAADGRPIVIDRDKSPLTEEDGRPYSGCYCNVKVSIYCQKGENPGVRASFSVVQFARDGEAFSGSKPSTDGFDDISAGADAEALV
jgi:hypothetical protein